MNHRRAHHHHPAPQVPAPALRPARALPLLVAVLAVAAGLALSAPVAAEHQYACNGPVYHESVTVISSVPTSTVIAQCEADVNWRCGLAGSPTGACCSILSGPIYCYFGPGLFDKTCDCWGTMPGNPLCHPGEVCNGACQGACEGFPTYQCITCPGGGSNPTCQTSCQCGNGIIEAFEQCDSSNLGCGAGQECTADCQCICTYPVQTPCEDDCNGPCQQNGLTSCYECLVPNQCQTQCESQGYDIGEYSNGQCDCRDLVEPPDETGGGGGGQQCNASQCNQQCLLQQGDGGACYSGGVECGTLSCNGGQCSGPGGSCICNPGPCSCINTGCDPEVENES